jgi:hypothetical protein
LLCSTRCCSTVSPLRASPPTSMYSSYSPTDIACLYVYMYSRLLLCTPVRPCRYLHDCVLYIMLLCRYSWSTIWSRAIHPDPPVELLPSGVTPYHASYLYCILLSCNAAVHTYTVDMCAATLHSALHCWELHALYVCSRLLATYGPHVVRSYPPRSIGCLLPSGVTPCNHEIPQIYSVRYVLASCRCIPYVLPYGPAQYCTLRTLRTLCVLSLPLCMYLLHPLIPWCTTNPTYHL